jgi:DNA-directed RNA polymerase specialized sigma24 family protein
VDPEKPLSKSEKVATTEEVAQEIEKLTSAEWAKLYAYARNRARAMALRGSTFSEQDLVQAAVTALLEERRHWRPGKVDFVGVLIGAIRSIASGYTARAEKKGYAFPASQFAAPEGEDEPESPTDIHPDGRLNPEQVVIVSDLLSEVYDLFQDDPEALVIMDGWRDEMSGIEIIEALEIDRKAYETIARRIRRKVSARWPKGGHHVR